MRRCGLSAAANAGKGVVLLSFGASFYEPHVSPLSTSGVTKGRGSRTAQQTARRCVHTSSSSSSGGAFARTAVALFDLRKHEMEKRRLRELEKAGIDPDNDDEGQWIAPEEQQRLDEEEEQRRAELEEQRKAYLEKRAEEDAVKRQKFKEFRAKQISMSRTRKEEVAEKKEEARQHRQQQNQRVVDADGAAATPATTVGETGEGDAGLANADATEVVEAAAKEGAAAFSNNNKK